MNRKRIIVLGATGSIGTQTIDVVRAFPDDFEIVMLSAHKEQAKLYALSKEFPRARLALSGTPRPENSDVGLSSPVVYGKERFLELIASTDAEIVVNGISGHAGLEPSLSALESGKNLALANKESVVMAYCLLDAAAHKQNKRILPVDSEHAALFQLLSQWENVQEVTITASGGAFRDHPLPSLASVTADEASVHPSWSMGRKISIDSASLANKGLEVIEASRLFSLAPSQVKVLIHPQSIVHALVRLKDGSLQACMSSPDMRLPILNALTFPEIMASDFGHLELAGQSLEFRAPDHARYPVLEMAYQALRSGYGATIAYNAADEVAVASFERGEIQFTQIPQIIEKND